MHFCPGLALSLVCETRGKCMILMTETTYAHYNFSQFDTLAFHVIWTTRPILTEPPLDVVYSTVHTQYWNATSSLFLFFRSTLQGSIKAHVLTSAAPLHTHTGTHTHRSSVLQCYSHYFGVSGLRRKETGPDCRKQPQWIDARRRAASREVIKSEIWTRALMVEEMQRKL